MATTAEVVKLLGVSYQRLNNWAAKGYINIVCQGSGSVREWTDEHIARAREIRDAFAHVEETLRAARLPVPSECRTVYRSGWTARTGRPG